MTAVRQPRASVGCLLVASLFAGTAAFAQAQSSAPAPADPAPAAAVPAPAAAAPAAPVDPVIAAAVEAGHTEYLKNCRPCHGSKGTAGVPLAGNEKVSAGPDYLIWAIITGPGYMPEFGPVLSNEEIASIVNFIENSWGNANGLVTPDDIQAAR